MFCYSSQGRLLLRNFRNYNLPPKDSSAIARLIGGEASDDSTNQN